MSREEFVSRMMFYEKVKKIQKGRQHERELRYYSAERCFDRNKGKVDTWKHAYVNMER